MTLFHTFSIAFIAFFAIMNPSATLPVYLSLTNDMDEKDARDIAHHACWVAFGVVTVFAFAGKMLFHLFGISLPALKIAGGVLIFMIGVQMLHGKSSQVQHPDQSKQRAARKANLSVAVSPLATPMMAGPGTIATAMNLSARADLSHAAVTVVAFALLCILTYVIYLGGKPVVHFLGQNLMNVITRLMGLILAVIGVQMLISGLWAAFPIIAPATP